MRQRVKSLGDWIAKSSWRLGAATILDVGLTAFAVAGTYFLVELLPYADPLQKVMFIIGAVACIGLGFGLNWAFFDAVLARFLPED